MRVTAADSAAELQLRAERAINNLKSSDSALTNLFEQSAGYAVFPNVRSSGPNGAVPVKGILYEKGKPVGEAVLWENAAHPSGPFHETIFFETAEAMQDFKESRLIISTDIGAVAAAEGAALNVKYRKGIAVFVIATSGLLETINIGDQKFGYTPLG